MIRIISAILVCVMLSMFICGCSATTPVNNTQNNAQNNLSTQAPETQRKVVDLTLDNIDEYLKFRTTVSDPNLYGINDTWRCNANLTVISTSMQNVEFKNLQISFVLKSESPGWEKFYMSSGDYLVEFKGTMSIPYNGTWEEVYDITSSVARYISEDPKIEFVITDVSGQVVTK